MTSALVRRQREFISSLTLLPDPATFPSHMNEPITVLLADDHAVVRAGIRQSLKHKEAKPVKGMPFATFAIFC